MKEQEYKSQTEQAQIVSEPAVVYGTITPSMLEEKIAIAREEYRNRTTDVCTTKEELQNFLDSL